MKNLLGEEVFTTQKEKEKFYDEYYEIMRSKKILPLEDFLLQRYAGKDDIFHEFLLPFCVEHHIQSVLDVGADYGYHSVAFLRNGVKNVTAMELTPARMSTLRKAMTTYGFNITLLCGDIEKVKIKNYDLIFCSDLVEHLVDYEATWKKMIAHSKYVYALIPIGYSWKGSRDHLHAFFKEDVENLARLSHGLEAYYTVVKDATQEGWHALLVRGALHG